jgi:branched-subunit amino acid ABC-type transport system permease component
LLVGLINGSFYAILSLGLAIIFGLLNIINFAHGAQYMMGAFVAWLALTKFNVNYWVALIAAPCWSACSGSSSSAPCCASCTSSTTSTGCC